MSLKLKYNNSYNAVDKLISKLRTRKIKKNISFENKNIFNCATWKSKPILEFLGYKLKIINGDLVREHKRYYNFEECNKLSKILNMEIKKFYFFQFGFNTVCILG